VAALGLTSLHAARRLLAAQAARDRGKGRRLSLAEVARLESRQAGADERYQTGLEDRLRALAAGSQPAQTLAEKVTQRIEAHQRTGTGMAMLTTV
jgi:hypothetical protein